MPKKDFTFFLSKKNNTVVFNLNLILLLVKFNSILEKQGCKKDILVMHTIGYIIIVFALLTKIIAFHI